MQIDQFSISKDEISYSHRGIAHRNRPSFVLIFADRKKLEKPEWLSLVQTTYPDTDVVSCSSSGLIYQDTLKENAVNGMAIHFEKTSVKIESAQFKDGKNSTAIGEELGRSVSGADLKHVLVFSDGWLVNASALVKGIYAGIPDDVTVSGGFAGDGDNFSNTLVGLNHTIEQGFIVVIGLYGEHLEIGFGKHGGWNETGEPMTVTRSNGRELQELDGKTALDFYKGFLGADANGLPGKALMYPLSVQMPGFPTPYVRTVFNIDEIQGSLSLGEAVPVGSTVQFMRSKYENATKGVEQAALAACRHRSTPPELALVISCIGRKLLFGKEIEEEIAITKKALGKTPVVGGFYSNGEICLDECGLAELHHQYLTVTTYSET
jgi:hypothetical protein